MYVPRNCAAFHNPRLRDGNVRLMTFEVEGWKIWNLNSDPKELSEAGFALRSYWSKDHWDGYCVFCPVVTGDWMTNHPLKYHEEKNPRCPFMQGYDVGNIPITNDPIRGIRSPLLGNYDVVDKKTV